MDSQGDQGEQCPLPWGHHQGFPVSPENERWGKSSHLSHSTQSSEAGAPSEVLRETDGYLKF